MPCANGNGGMADTPQSTVADDIKVTPVSKIGGEVSHHDSDDASRVPENQISSNSQGSVSSSKVETPLLASGSSLAEAAQHLIQGKRHLLVQDISAAVESLQKACELTACHFKTDDAFESAEPLLYYGRALLELHRKESGALGNVCDPDGDQSSSGDSEPEDEDGDDEPEDKNGENDRPGPSDDGKLDEDEEDLEKPDPALKDSKLDEPAPLTEKQYTNSSNDLKKSGSTNEENHTSETTEADAQETDDDNVSTLQIAFEVLDLSKKIFKREAEKKPELYLKAADCLLLLGEVGLESDTYEQALEDFQECLRIQQEMLPGDAREIANTNYQLGMTYSYINMFEESAAYFADAIQILELKVGNLKKEIELVKAKGEPRGSLDDDPVWCAEREIEEIQSLLPEISVRLEDARQMRREKADDAKERVIGEMLDRTPETSPVKKETKVNVIGSNMIKRKRPLADVEGGSSSGESSKEKQLKKE